MSQHHDSRRVRGSFPARRRRLSAGIGALAVSGLVLSGLASPAAALELPKNVTLEQWADVASSWTTGALGVNGKGASGYAEGQTIPFRLDVTSAGVGTFDFSVCRDYQNGNIRGYLGLEPFDTRFADSSPLLSATVTHPANGTAQPFTGAAVGGSVLVDSVHEVGGAGSCGANLRETQVRIVIDGASPGAAPAGAYVLWGGRLASPEDAEVGPGNGASRFPGGSLSMRLGGSAKNVGIKTSAIIPVQDDPEPEPGEITDPLPPTTTTTTTEPTTTTTTTEPEPTSEPEPTTTTTTTTTSEPEPTPDPGEVEDPGPGSEPGEVDDPIADPEVESASTTETDPVPVFVLSGTLEREPPVGDEVTTAGTAGPAPAVATLPRTGTTIGNEVTLALGLVTAGLALLRLSRRPRQAAATGR